MFTFNFNTIVSLVLILGLGASLIWVVIPKYDEVRNLMNEISVLNADLQTKIEIKAKIDDLKARYQTYSRQIGKVSEILPPAKDYPGFLVTLQQLTAASGMIMDSVDIKEAAAPAKAGLLKAAKAPAAEEPFKKLSVTLAVAGSYEQFKGFLRNLESNVRIIDVKTADFDYSEKELIRFNIQAETYYQP